MFNSVNKLKGHLERLKAKALLYIKLVSYPIAYL